MKLNIEERDITSNVKGETIHFGLDDNSPILFQILRNKIYTNPIGAVCRELLSNARDAHREVGKDEVPIQVWTPGDYLVIKDFGPGISPDRMKNVYSKYGASTKRKDNVQTGGFGLGAKTYFAYGDSAVIETVVDGIKYIYSAYLDETDKGLIQLLSSNGTTESSHTAIKVPVKTEDKTNFRNALYHFIKYWKVQPHFVGEIRRDKLTPVYEEDRWVLYNEPTEGYSILCDEIPYKCIISLPNKVIFKFNTGELDLAATRDSLQYTSRTNEAISRVKEQFLKEIGDKIQERMKKEETFLKAVKLINSLSSEAKKRRWKWRDFEFEYPFPGFQWSQDTNKNVLYSLNSEYGKYRTSSVYELPDDTEEISFIELDKSELSSYDKQRVSYYKKSNNLKRVFLMSPGLLPVKTTPLTQIKVKRGCSSSNGGRKTEVKCWDVNYHRSHYEKTDSATPILYYVIKGQKRIHRCRYCHIELLGAKIVEVNQKHVKYLGQNWQEVGDFLKEKLFDKYTTQELEEVVSSAEERKTYKHLGFLSQHHSDFAFLDENQPLLQKYDQATIKLIEFVYKNRLGGLEVKPTPLYEKYPMLSYVNEYKFMDESSKKKIINYVKLINHVNTNSSTT